MLLPDVAENAGELEIRRNILDIAHEGHTRENAIKRYVRSRLWFPAMEESIATEKKRKDPFHHLCEMNY